MQSFRVATLSALASGLATVPAMAQSVEPSPIGGMFVALLPSIIIIGLGIAWPAAIILRRVGFSRWWAVLAFIPLVNIVGLWVLAVISWPNLSRPR